MKRKFEWGAVLFTVCFIFVVRFGLLEGPAEFLFFSKDSLKYVSVQLTYEVLGSGNVGRSVLNTTEPALSPPEQMSAVLASNITSLRTSLGAWGGLNRMLNRSDLPVEVEESFREGLSAWRSLSRIVDEGNAEGHESETVKQCPHSVGSTNATESGVSLPCGLILDSSITVVATPLPGAREFQIELLGAKSPGEHGQPPVILHYNVRFQGDQLTDQAVIIQNTWTPIRDWDEEERCPSPVALEPSQVDILDRCFEQVGKVSTWKPQAAKESPASTWPRILKSPDKLKPWFPYAEGMPFAATVRVGWEGFHVTVNGRHISSFQYRQGLEPWLVGEVEVRGGLKLSSIFATGLPISETMGSVSGLEFLRAPPLPPKSKKLALFIGVFSSSSNFDRRMAQRKSWMQYDAVRSGDVVVRFFVGLHKQEQVNKELWEEARTFGDLQLLPFVDYYYLITLKTAAICIYVSKHLKADYVMKTDDDTFVRVDIVLSLIQNRKRDMGFLLGQVEKNNAPERDKANKWYISREEWPEDTYPPWAHGPGYIFSSDIAKFISRISDSPRLKLFKLEDVAMGMWIDDFRQKQNQSVEYVHNDNFISGGCAVNYVIAHYQTPRQMLCLWNQLRSTGKALCCD